MSWRIRTLHRTGYEYASDVRSSYNEVRITPLTTHRQLCLYARVEVSPAARAYRYNDYWGSVVDAFDIHVPHHRLTVTGASVVETATPEPPPPSPGWNALRTAAHADEYAELLAASAYTPEHPELTEIALDIAAGAATPSAAARQALAWVGDRLTYEPGSTHVHTSAVDAWQQGVGVCQDFAHLSLSLLRAMGIPARYASGYLHPYADAGVGEEVTGQSHAWIEWWDGDWRGFDPANQIPVGERHVVVARGRDYRDVAPISGIYHGGPSASLVVDVRLTREG